MSLPVDDSPSIFQSHGIKQPPRTTKGKYKWSPGTGWKKEDLTDEERPNTDMRSREVDRSRLSRNAQQRQQESIGVYKVTMQSSYKTPRYRDSKNEQMSESSYRTRTPRLATLDNL